MKRAREGAAEGAEPGAPRASALRASSGAPPEDDLDEDLYFEEPSATSGGVRTGADCPYLDTINRQARLFAVRGRGEGGGAGDVGAGVPARKGEEMESVCSSPFFFTCRVLLVFHVCFSLAPLSSVCV